jgi:hypothetical protein
MNILTPTVSLKLPVQVTSERTVTESEISSEVEITQEDVDAEFFSPRSVAPPMDFAMAPPGYCEYSTVVGPSHSSPSTRVPEVRIQ